MALSLIGTKLGMTRVYDKDGIMRPVTVVHVGGNVVSQIKTTDKDGYEAVQLAYGDQKEQRLSKPVLGHLKKAGVTPKRVLRECRTEAGDFTAGKEVPVTIFAVNQYVDVIGVSKGKGVQGVIRRHNMSGQNETHGSMMHRRNGAIGCRSKPGRVYKNMGMPGHMGDEHKTIQNLLIVQVREEESVILVQGAIPGANGQTVVIRPSVKGRTYRERKESTRSSNKK